MTFRRFVAGAALGAAAIVLSACQSGNPLGALQPAADTAQQQPQLTVDELRAFCPSVSIRQSNAILSAFERGGDGDASRLRHRATLSEATRSCTYEPGIIRMNVAAAGRLVPGPRGATGTVSLPVEVFVIDRNQRVYERRFNLDVQVADVAGATQFVLNDPQISFPTPSRNTQVFVSFVQD